MKKIIAFIISVVMLLSVFSFSASAAGTYGENEKKVIADLSAVEEHVIDGKTIKFIIPVNYVNQAKAFYVSTEGDITEEQYKEIMKFVNEGKKLVTDTTLANTKYYDGQMVDIAKMPQAIRSAVLKAGQNACAVVNLSLIFNGKDVVITDWDGAIRFEDRPIIKTTGSGFNVSAVAAVFGALAIAVCGALAVAKKKDLFCREN